MPNQISVTPCDKKFRRWVIREIKDIFTESETMEDAEWMIIHVFTMMLESNRSAWIRLEKEQ